MKAQKKPYTVYTANKVIVIDDSIKRKQTDTEDIQMYINAGYVIRHKSKARSEAAKGRCDSLTAEQIRADMSVDQPALVEFEQIMQAKGFFSGKKFYKNWKSEQAEKADKERGGMTAAELPDKPVRRKPGRKPKAAVAEGSAAEAAEGLSESEG